MCQFKHRVIKSTIHTALIHFSRHVILDERCNNVKYVFPLYVVCYVVSTGDEASHIVFAVMMRGRPIIVAEM